MTTKEKKLQQPPMLFLPPRQARVASLEYRHRQGSKKLGWGVKAVDDYMTPLSGGDLMTLIARPGNAKTTTLIHLAKQAEKQLEADGLWPVYVTWETLVEEFVAILTAGKSGQSLESIARGQADLSAIGKALAPMVVQSRIVVIGRSYESRANRDLRLEDVDDCLTWMEDNGYPPGLLMADYLQRIPWRHHSDNKAMGVSENLVHAKNLLLKHRIPGIVPVQAKRDVDSIKGIRLPRMDDGQWTSNIEQDSDKVVSMTRPATYRELGSEIEDPATDLVYEVTEDTLVIGWLKQRWGRAGARQVLDLDVKTATLSEAQPMTPAF